MPTFKTYHGHFYFSSETMTSAELIRQKMILQLPQLLRVFPLLPREVGPHPMPMFEFHFRGSDYVAVMLWLRQFHKGHSVLIHPLSGDELKDHTELAEFIGPELGLKLKAL